MNRLVKIAIITGAILLVLGIILFAVHEAVESKVFGMISSRNGGQLSIGSKKGNLLSGYEFRNLTVNHTVEGRSGPEMNISIPRFEIKWSLFPFKLKKMEWDAGSIHVVDEDGEDDIPFGEASLESSGNQWLESIDSIDVGPEDWYGDMELRLKRDGSAIDAAIEIDMLPSRYVDMIGDVPSWFNVPARVNAEVNITGNPSNPELDGYITNPNNGVEFNF